MPYDIHNPLNSKPFGQTLDGLKLAVSDGTELDLDKDAEVPTVIIFGLEFCMSCIAEVKMIQESIKNPSGIPTKINLYSLLVGVTQSEAHEWKLFHKVRWPVAYEEKSNLFNRFCPEKVFPCVLINTPQKGIVYVEQKETTLEELKTWTGPWEDEE